MADAELDQNEPATPYKLEKARERGQAAKSADAVSAVVFATAVVYLSWNASVLIKKVFVFDRSLLVHAMNGPLEPHLLWPLLESVLSRGLLLLAPMLVAFMLVAMLGNLIQTGPILSMEPVKMDLQRINPATGVKRIFSMRVLFDGARTLMKLAFLGLVAYFGLSALLPRFYGLASLTASAYLETLIEIISRLAIQMTLVLCLIALIDLLYTRHEFAKKMRMSHRERKDEVKQREGDPRIRARMRQLRREMLKKSLALQKTRTADVLITNPTHIAIALRYVQSEMPSPLLVAKGMGKHAGAMREIAAKHRIPVVQNPPLARRLYRELSLEQNVPSHMFAEVARIIVWVFAMRKQQAHTAASAT